MISKQLLQNFFLNTHLGFSLIFTVVCHCQVTGGIPPPSGGIGGENRSSRIIYCISNFFPHFEFIIRWSYDIPSWGINWIINDPFTAQLVRQPQPQSHPSGTIPTGTTLHCCYIVYEGHKSTPPSP